MEGVWKCHPVYTSYEACQSGRVRNRQTGKILLGGRNSSGYKVVKPVWGKRRVERGLHRIVYECFKGIPPAGHHIDHVNGDKDDCCLANLESLSHQQHMAKTLKTNPNMATKRAQAHAVQVTRRDSEGNTVIYPSIQDATRSTKGANHAHIIDCTKGRRRTHCGYAWEVLAIEVDTDETWACLRNPRYKRIQVSDKGRYMTSRGVAHDGHIHATYRKVMVGGKHVPMHRLVCEAFHGHAPTDMSSVDHIDQDRLNNTAGNLCWSTSIAQGENMSSNRSVAAFEPGTMVPRGQWTCISAACRETGAHVSTIINVCKGKGKTGGGLVWKYL